MMPLFILLIVIFCHMFILVLWTTTSRGGNFIGFIKTWNHIRSAPIVIFEGIGFVQILLLPWFTLPIMYVPNLPIQILGLTISLIGVALASWAKVIMGMSWGRPAQHDKDKQTKLVTTGPFRFTRNPIYVGLWLLFTGQQIALGSYGIVLTVLFAVVISKSVAIEEKLLEEYFGKAYTVYKSRVPRFLFL